MGVPDVPRERGGLRSVGRGPWFKLERKGSRGMGRILFAALFLLGGVGHFAAPDVYLRIMPPGLPEPRALVFISGAAEILLGALLLGRRTRIVAAWGLIALLVAVFPANLFMWRHAERFAIPPLFLLIRLPLQGLLIAWAWRYTGVRRGTVPAGSARSMTLPTLLTLAMLTSFSGCGIWGASLDRLKGGSMARAKNLSGQPITVFFAASEETVSPGTVVKVVADDEGTVNQVDRKVIVGFESGPHHGLAALMRRSDLEPDR